MEALFLQLINMSIKASWLVLAIIAVRLIFKKVPKWILCLLWGLVAFRLICPFSMESALSLIPSAEPLPQEIIYTAHPQIHSGVPILDNAVNPILESGLTPIEPTSANPTQIWSFILARVWLLGLVMMLGYALVSYLLLRRKVAAAIPLRKNIRRCEFIDSPFVLGFLFPVIYLPTALEKKDWEYVIAHEEAHIQRRDHWWKPMGFLLLSVYWFNPFVWVAYILLCRDIEAACDEKVIRDMDKDALRAYSTALLQSSVHKRSVTACPLAFGEVGIKERIKHVMNYKKPSFWAVAVSAALMVLICITFLTDPERKYDPDKVYPQAVLAEPDRIYVDVSGTDRVFEKDTEVYRQLLEAFRANWWKYAQDNSDRAADAALVAPIAPEVLKTRSWRTYVEISDTIVCFQYTENPVLWENADGEQMAIETIGFVLPEKNWSEDNTKGFFLISKTDKIGYNEGIYTYYYPPEIASDFWGFVNNAKLNEVRTVPGKTMTLNDVIILSQLGTEITVDDFGNFAYEEQGDSLLYTRTYPINEAWYLRMHHGGGLPKPIAVWLTHAGTGEHIDITQGNEEGAITDFIGRHNPEGAGMASAWFDAILSGEGAFYNADRAEEMTLSQFCEAFGDISGASVSVSEYSLADLDADGWPELLLRITMNQTDDYGVLVLRYDERIIGYEFAYRQLMEIKQDGTFRYSGGVYNNGMARLIFTEAGWEYAVTGGVMQSDEEVTYIWNDQVISQGEYQSHMDDQDAKQNVVWNAYPFGSEDGAE